jgi:hypothetical protein
MDSIYEIYDKGSNNVTVHMLVTTGTETPDDGHWRLNGFPNR